MEDALRQDGRPRAVIVFEAVSILSAVAEMMLTQGESAFAELVQLLLIVGLTLWVTRGRSRVARQIYTAVMLLGGVALAASYTSGYIPSGRLPTLLLLASFALALVPLWLLWRPSTSAWLKATDRQASSTG